MGHVTTLKLQETEHQDCHVWFGPVKDTWLPQVKSELGSSKECGVGIGQQLISEAPWWGEMDHKSEKQGSPSQPCRSPLCDLAQAAELSQNYFPIL